MMPTKWIEPEEHSTQGLSKKCAAAPWLPMHAAAPQLQGSEREQGLLVVASWNCCHPEHSEAPRLVDWPVHCALPPLIAASSAKARRAAMANTRFNSA